MTRFFDSTADLDALLEAFGDDVVFADGVVTTKGFLDREDVMGDDGNGIRVVGATLTLCVRPSTVPDTLREDAPLTVISEGKSTDYLVRDTGYVRADGLQQLLLVEV